jgi:hypothetical protein
MVVLADWPRTAWVAWPMVSWCATDGENFPGAAGARFLLVVMVDSPGAKTSLINTPENATAFLARSSQTPPLKG